MTSEASGWDWWSEVKLAILRDYLAAFTLACSKSSEVLCLDLFAGGFDNARRHSSGAFPGSTRVALETEPPFTKLAFFELPEMASKLRADITAARPHDDRWRVFAGDCNDHIGEALDWLAPVRWAPTFAFLDPRGLQVAWSTVETLARWRSDKKTKVEQWMLFPEPALARVLGLKGVRGRSSADKLNRLFGTDDWIAIHQLRRGGHLDGEGMRAEFVNLLRWRLENALGYRTTHALQIVNTRGHPVYTMVFATDSAPGSNIMSHVYGNASAEMIPAMQARAQAARRRRDEEAAGKLALFDLDEVVVSRPGERYQHVQPWEPPCQVEEQVVLDDEPTESEDVDLEAWLDEQDFGGD